MILCIGTTPAAQRVMFFHKLALDRVNRARTTLDGAAGKSINVAKVLRVLGAKPVATGFFGGMHGQQLRRILEEQNIELDFVTVDTPTRECVTVIEESTGAITELVEESRPVAAIHYDALLEIVARRVSDCQALVMSGTIASGGPPHLYFRCTQLAHQARALSVVDASGPALIQALDARPGLVKPNRVELEKTMGRAMGDERTLMDSMRDLHSRGAQRIVITAGGAPALAYDGQCFWRITSPRVAVVNPIGSGDAFTAALVWRLTLGDGLAESCRWAGAAGAANALTAMAGDVHRDDVHRLLPDVQIERI